MKHHVRQAPITPTILTHAKLALRQSIASWVYKSNALSVLNRIVKEEQLAAYNVHKGNSQIKEISALLVLQALYQTLKDPHVLVALKVST